MKISTGIAEISMQRPRAAEGVNRKVYIWPSYGEGKVEKIRGIIRRTESDGIYSKPLPEDRDKVLKEYNNFQNQYNSAGSILKTHVNLRPGLLFDALV